MQEDDRKRLRFGGEKSGETDVIYSTIIVFNMNHVLWE